MCGRFFLAAALALGTAACFPTPPAPPTPISTEAVNASRDKTWDAVIQIFALNTIPIRTIDRASGLIVTDPLSVLRDQRTYADCGKGTMKEDAYPSTVAYNVLVHGDSAQSSVRVTARWVGIVSGITSMVTVDCSTRGIWETSLQNEVKDLAEGRGTRRDATGAVVLTAEQRCTLKDAAVVGRDQTDAETYVPDQAQSGCVVHYCHYASSAVNWDKTAALAKCRTEAVEKRE